MSEPTPEIYVSADVETDGPYPGGFSMLSLGAAAFAALSRAPIATFEVNLCELDGASRDPATMAWWAEQDPKIWAHARENPQKPEAALRAFADWARALPGKPVLVTWPSWDIGWFLYYLSRFAPDHPFGISALDLKSMAFGQLGMPTFRGTSKKNLPKELFEGCPPHTHRALDDALEQGVFAMNLLAARVLAKPRGLEAVRARLDTTIRMQAVDAHAWREAIALLILITPIRVEWSFKATRSVAEGVGLTEVVLRRITEMLVAEGVFQSVVRLDLTPDLPGPVPLVAALGYINRVNGRRLWDRAMVACACVPNGSVDLWPTVEARFAALGVL